MIGNASNYVHIKCIRIWISWQIIAILFSSVSVFTIHSTHFILVNAVDLTQGVFLATKAAAAVAVAVAALSLLNEIKFTSN